MICSLRWSFKDNTGTASSYHNVMIGVYSGVAALLCCGGTAAWAMLMKIHHGSCMPSNTKRLSLACCSWNFRLVHSQGSLQCKSVADAFEAGFKWQIS